MSGADISCAVFVEGVRVADDAASYLEGIPTVLTGLKVQWGRDTVLDQPAPAALTATLAESEGGTGGLELVNVGYTVDVYAGATLPEVGTDPVPVAVDGGFETTPAVTDRALSEGAQPSRVTYTGYSPHGDARAIRVARSPYVGVSSSYDATWTRVPPAPFSTVAGAWDNLPTVAPGQSWTLEFYYRYHFAPANAPLYDAPLIFSTPAKNAPVAPTVNGGPAHTFDTPAAANVRTWRKYTRTVTIAAGDGPHWLGVALTSSKSAAWNDPAWAGITWATVTPSDLTWEQVDALDIDDLQIYAPPSARLTSLVFSGRITELGLSADDPGAAITLIASDPSADMANDNIGSDPFLAQTIKARINAIKALSTVLFTYVFPANYGNFTVTWADVDNQPVMGLLQDLAVTADLVLWAAFHQTKGFYLWFEDPMTRSALGGLWLNPGTGKVEIDYSQTYRPADAVLVSACDIPRDAPGFAQTVADVISRVDATWLEQLTDDKGQPAPTERNVHIKDTSLEADFGIRRVSLSTQLTTRTDCLTVSNRVLARSQDMNWTADGITWDTQYPLEFHTDNTQYAMRLLDGVQRNGLPVTITDLPDWAPSNPQSNYYLEGGTYTYDDGRWILELNLSPSQTIGRSVRWNELPAAWKWNMFDRTIAWSDLWGVGIAGATLELERLTANIVER